MYINFRVSKDSDLASDSSDEEAFSEYEIERFKRIAENKKKFDELYKSKTKAKSIKAKKNLKPEKAKVDII